jgi:SAM-dependent methyltransferase
MAGTITTLVNVIRGQVTPTVATPATLAAKARASGQGAISMNKIKFERQMDHTVADSFDALVPSYESYAKPPTIQFVREALSRSGCVMKGESIDRYGLRHRALALEAAKAGAKVLAIDLSPSMIARLSKRLVRYPGNEARVMDGASLDLPDNSFDAGFSVFAATYFPDWHQALSELVRVVRVGGRVVVTHWSDPADLAAPTKILAAIFSELFPHNATSLSPGTSPAHTSESLRKDLTDVGCENIRIEEIKVASIWPEPTRLIEELDPILCVLRAFGVLSDAERALMKAPLTAAFAAHALPNGTVELTDAALIAMGDKQS